MTRLVHLAGYTPPQGGSFIPFMRSVLIAGKERGWSTDAVFPEGARGRDWLGQFDDAGVPVHFVSGSRREITSWLGELLGARPEPTILHTHFTVFDVAAALVARRRPEVGVYWHIHTVLSEGVRPIAANFAKFSIVGRYVDRILSPSADVAAAVEGRGGNSAKVSVFPNTIDARTFPTLTAERRRDYRQRLGVGDGVEGLLHFGRDWYIKDGDIFLDALGVLVGEGRPVVGLINQGGEEARHQAASRGLQSHVKVTDLDPEVQSQYGAADVMVSSSRGETMPFTVMEALCSGTPVVASDLPGHRYLGDELDACTITGRDADEIAAAIRSFLDMDPGERARQCAVAREWIVDRLDVRSAARRMVESYEETLHAQPGRPS